MAVAAEPDVFGREAERARIDAFAASVRGGARALLIRGEPGIGKTALWRHGIDRCRRAGFQALIARPAEDEMPLAIVGLADLFEDVGLDVDVLRAEDAAFTAGRAVLEILRRLARNGPTLVAVDDVQWLDSASARALRYALRRLDPEPVGVLATARVGVGTDDPLAAATTLPPGRHETIHLGPMSLSVLRLVLGGTITAISRPTLRRIHEVSGGNPLYAIELARALPAQDEQAREPAGELPLPDSLQAAIARRLETVPVELSPLLETASALGPASVAELRETLGAGDLDPPLGSAVQLGLLVVDERLEVRFTHPLIGSAVYRRMSMLARRSLHARLAARAVDPDVRARHLARSTDEPDAEVAALLDAAAERAAARGAFDLAAEFARHSRRLTAPGADDLGRRRAQTEIEHLARAGDVGRALSLADRLVATVPAGPGRAEALIQRSDLEADDPAVSLAFLGRALDDAGEDRLLRARVLQELAFTRFLYLGDLREAIEDAREAHAIARRIDDVRLEVDAAAGLAHLEAIAGRPRIEHIEKAIALQDETGRSPLNRNPRSLLGKQLRWAGELAAARAASDASGTSEFRRPYRMYDAALIECAAGNLALAEELVTGGLEAARDAGDRYGERAFLYPLALVQAWLGRSGVARSTAGRLLERALRLGERLDVVAARKVLGVLALSEGDAAAAVEELGPAARLLEQIGVEHPGFYAVLPDAVEAFAWSGDHASSEALLDRLERQAAAVGSAWAEAAAEHCRGVLALARGDADAATAAVAHAAASFDGLGHGPDAARALLTEGRAHLRAGRRVRAIECVTEARDRFASIGAALWEARALEQLERAAPGRAAGELTSTELGIAGLVAQGMRNKEIAQTLFISVATVEAHLTRIYRKLDIRSRSELARLVAEGTIVPSDD